MDPHKRSWRNTLRLRRTPTLALPLVLTLGFWLGPLGCSDPGPDPALVPPMVLPEALDPTPVLPSPEISQTPGNSLTPEPSSSPTQTTAPITDSPDLTTPPPDPDVDNDGWTTPQGDCNDQDAGVHPGMAEVPYDSIDQDCSGSDLIDVDQDGTPGGPDGQDCDDTDPARAPTLEEIPYDGIDQDCTGLDLVDQDGDGYSALDVGGTDCHDSLASVNPGAEDIPYDGIDQDCSGTDLTDVDQDGQSSTQVGGSDCNDQNPVIYADAPEYLDGLDNDCDGQIDNNLSTLDADQDGYSPATGDCNDSRNDIYPGAAEVSYDGLDQDCQGGDQNDVDGDGYSGGPDQPDCNDQDPSIHPGAAETAYDGIDQDCLGGDLIDVDTDGFASTLILGGTDCDDSDPLISPSGIEIPYDDIDQDCTGGDQIDVDGDGFPGVGGGGEDCNDFDASIQPWATEVCDGVDQDCDGAADDEASDAQTFYTDQDQDGYGDPAKPVAACSATSGLSSNGQDCNDTDAKSYPGADEQCDQQDNNCNGDIDEGVTLPFYIDFDKDGYGGSGEPLQACDAPEGYAETGDDCDDTNPQVHPDAQEVCNGQDDNCDDQIDEGITSQYFVDADLDTYGNPSLPADLCEAKLGYSLVGGDCDDSNSAIHPGASEICDEKNTDENCNALADDLDPTLSASSKPSWYLDNDLDGYGTGTAVSSCESPGSGYATLTGDCNDRNSAIKPGATEVVADGVDQNCDGKESCYADMDNDDYRPSDGSTVLSSDLDCLDSQEGGNNMPSGDCNDQNGSIHPGAQEVTGDEVDQSCDGKETCYKDADDDGYRPDATSTVASSDTDCTDTGEAKSTDPTGDCNDKSATVNPIASEVIGDSIDANCDGKEYCYVDADDDGYRPDSGTWAISTDTDCTDPYEALATDAAGDCNDTNPLIRPGVSEVTGDGVDQNCDGLETCYKDSDNDGYRPDLTSTVASSDADCTDSGEALASEPSGDCDDTNASRNPAQAEVPDGVDQDCDGTIDDGVYHASCKAIRAFFPSYGNGAYLIDPDGSGPIAVFSAYCDMVTDGGGWTIVTSITGGNGEQPLVSNTETAGNPLLLQAYNINRAKKMALSSLATESLFRRSDGTWMKASAALFDGFLDTANTHMHKAVTLTTSTGATASAFMGYSNYNITAGGDFGISQAPDAATCAGTTSNGFDHHATAYNHLNCSCSRQYLYSYSSASADSDAGYDANVALSGWSSTNTCEDKEGGKLAFYAAVR